MNIIPIINPGQLIFLSKAIICRVAGVIESADETERAEKLNFTKWL
jgi:hypothetical protein